MGTVSRELAEEIKRNDGYYETDPRVLRIIEYDNRWGGIGYGLEYEHDLGRYKETPFVIHPRVFFEAKAKIDGEETTRPTT